MSELLGQPVPLVPDCIGVSVGAALSTMKDGDVALLENVRFYPEEEKNDPAFAKKLVIFSKEVIVSSFLCLNLHLDFLSRLPMPTSS